MVSWPDITVLMLTYNRPEEFRRTFQALQDNLYYPGELYYLVVDDGSQEDYLSQYMHYPHFAFDRAEENMGWGKRVNTGLQLAHAPYIFFLEDDYVLTTPLDMSIGVALLESTPSLGMVRYGGTAGCFLNYYQKEADIRDWLPDYREFMAGVRARITYLEISPYSPSLFVYSHQPHLFTRKFLTTFGPYREDLQLAKTEESYCFTVREILGDNEEAPRIAVLPEFICPKFDHIGRSYQNTEKDKVHTA